MTSIPEQPDDWTTPGAFPVAPGVHRIPLPLPHDGLHAVNTYTLEDRDGLVVVDSGWAGPDNLAALEQGLKELDHRLADITLFVVTHAHWDHYTQAVALREELGIPVRMGAGERPSIESYDASEIAYPVQARQLLRCGAVELAAQIGARWPTESEQQMPFSAPDAWIADREVLPLAGRSLEALSTPGHTRGHIVLRDTAAEFLLSGDHVLPHITPSIGLERSPEALPLRSYLDSLALLRGEPDLLLLPAHGPVCASTHPRIDELLRHHEQRLNAVQEQVRQGRDDAFLVAQALPWTRRARRLEELDLINRMLAVLEIKAHLDVLADVGRVSLVSDGDRDHYDLEDNT